MKMNNFKSIENVGYINVDNITYISDVFQRVTGTWEFNIHFTDGAIVPVATDSESKSESIIRYLIEKH